jgi:AraC family transcriptional activator FtrA
VPKSAAPPNQLVCALAYDEMALFEFSIGVEVFGLDRPEMGDDWYRFRVASLDPAPLRATAGVRVAADAGLEALDAAGTILIPGWPFRKRRPPPELLDTLRRAHARGARLVSICSGAFVLAETGLLDGKRATTHWKYTDAFRQRFPNVDLVPDVLYVDEGQILTSAGSAAGLDVCLHLIRRDFGPEAANKVAASLVIPPHRDGGQAQFIARAVPSVHERNRLGPLLDFLYSRLHEPHRTADLARRAGMSERTFLRRFSEATGTTPTKWLLTARLGAARDHLEAGELSVEDVAARTGFGTPTNLRHHFREQLNTTPTAYRQAFARTPAEA